MGNVRNTNKAKSELKVCTGIAVQFRKSECICHHKLSINEDLSLQLSVTFPTILYEGLCLGGSDCAMEVEGTQ